LQLRRSLTWDQGKEMALHAEITAMLAMPVFFCEKASPRQQPSNEHTNGLLRQYLPKGTDLSRHSPISSPRSPSSSTPGPQDPRLGYSRRAAGRLAGTAPRVDISCGPGATVRRLMRVPDGWREVTAAAAGKMKWWQTSGVGVPA
jgi:hypothetical protein